MPEPLNVIPRIPWPAPQSWLYMGLILINISGDWIGQPAPQKLQKIKQNGIIICNAGRVRELSLGDTINLVASILSAGVHL